MIAWVAPGPEKQQVAAAGALEVAEGAPDVDEGDQAVLAPIQAPQPPVVRRARTMAQRLGRFTTWTVIGLSRMMDQVGVRYTSYLDYHTPYVRRTRRRTDDASTSAPQQLDP
ncbi:hypothetical protein Tco_1127295 [Tanacetum coccineum]